MSRDCREFEVFVFLGTEFAKLFVICEECANRTIIPQARFRYAVTVAT